jgi:predicted proteasome-type protease
MKDFKNASEYLWKFKHLSDSITQVMKKSENNKLIAEINKNIQKRDEKKLEQVKIDFALVFALFAMILSVFVLIVYKKKQKGSQTYNEFGNGNFLQNTEEKKKPEIDPEIIKELLLLVKNDIDTFYIEFPKIYPDFYQSLQKEYPSLTISDYSFCALVKMNFTVKEISLYTKLSLRSVEGRKYRIMKKMKVSNQNELYIVLSSIS